MSTAALPDPRQSQTKSLLPGNSGLLISVVEAVASMKLTIVLFLLSMVIVLIGSLAQAQKDVWDVVNQYFRTWIAWIEIKDCFPPSMFLSIHQNGLFGKSWEQLGKFQMIPFPGGWTIGTIMFANLFAAHALRFRIKAQKAQLVFGGVLLLLGGLATLAVVLNGNVQQGVETMNWWLSVSAIWTLLLVTLSISVVGCFAAAAFLKSASGTARVIYALTGVLLAILLTTGMATGQINPSSMRILWQLLKGTACATIILAGCLLWFGKRAGVVVIHVGVALLMVSELLVGINAEENQLSLTEGDTQGFLRDIRERELAIVVREDGKQKTVTVPDWMIDEAARKGSPPIDIENLPFLIQVDKYAKNSSLRPLLPGEDRPTEQGTASFAVIQEIPPQDGMANAMDWAAVQVSLLDKNSKQLLQTLVCAQEISEGRLVPIAERANFDGQEYNFYYRFQRNYRDYKVKLLDVSRELYLGSSTAKDFRSKIEITNNKTGQTDTYEVWMNNPLRYNGETFYQSDYDQGKDGKEITMLSVVKNDGWMLPYIACMFVAVGMLAQFGITLTRFLNKTERTTAVPVTTTTDNQESTLSAGIRKAAPTEENFLDTKDPLQNSIWPVVVPIVVCVLAMAWVGRSWAKSRSTTHDPLTMNLKGFSALPVVWRGRSQPMDSFARVQLLMASHKSTFTGELTAEELAFPDKRKEIIQAVAERWPNAKTGELVEFNGQYLDWIQKIKELTGSGDTLVEETVRDIMVARMPAVRWMLDVIARPELAERHRVIRIQDDQLLNKLKLKQRHGQLYSLSEFRSQLPELRSIHQAGLALQDSTRKHEMTDLQRRTVSLFNTVRNIDSLTNMFRTNREFGLVSSLVESWWLLERLGDLPAVMAVPTNIDKGESGKKHKSWDTMLVGHALATAMTEIQTTGVTNKEELLTYVEKELPKTMLTRAIGMNREFLEQILRSELKRKPTNEEISQRARSATAGISSEDTFLRDTLRILADADLNQTTQQIVDTVPASKLQELAQERMSADLFRIARELENNPDKSRLQKLRAELRQQTSPDADDLIQVSNRIFLGLALNDLEEHIGDLLYDSEKSETYRKSAEALAGIITAWKNGDIGEFNNGIQEYADHLKSKTITDVDQRRITSESVFNEFDPFWKAIYLYLPVMLLTFFGWLFFPTGMYRTGFWLMATAFAVHTFGLVMRIWISGRPPVTNLYSSAIFIGWGVVLASFIVEILVSNGLGNLLGSAAGASSLVIAHYLSIDEGDTMGVMVAVLDTTFWLATHVVCITLGYAATFLAGFLGLIYVTVKAVEPLTGPLAIRSRTRSKATTEDRKSSFLAAAKHVGFSILTAGISGTRLGKPRKLTDVLGSSVYGTVCFAIFFSLVGTVLGGLWADDSWGRFWGWDPKENGAMLIVIWNAVILHARWDRLVRDYGVAVLAMIGNIVTAWSWFGVNELSAGLHNYGFTEGRLLALATFVGIQAIIVVAATVNGWWTNKKAVA